MGTLVQESTPWGTSGLKTGAAGLVAKVWSGRDTLSRSPKDSPPVEKKRLRRLANTWLYQQQRAPLASLDDTLLGDAPSEADASLTQAPRSKSLPRPIIRPSGATTRPRDRRVTFRPQVTVEYMDDDKHIKTEQADLVVGPRNRQLFMHRNLTRIAQMQKLQIQANQPQISSAVHEMSDTIPTSMSPPHLSATLEANKNTLLMNAQNEVHSAGATDSNRPQVNIYFIPDKSEGTKMKMVVNIGAQFHPDDICVKANMSGNKVRVMASKVVVAPDGTRAIEPINERFVLPMDVDPYAVEARLDTKGHLTIEAPLLTNARRAALSSQGGPR